MKVLITGGHHTSALPVIDELKRRNREIEIEWVGHKHTLRDDDATTLEYSDIKKLNIPFYTIKAGKFYKNYSLNKLARIPLGFIKAFFLLLKLKPDIVLSFGGYIAAPVVFNAWLLGIPAITHEQTVVVGIANKFISRFVKRIFVSWENSREYFPKNKIIYSGLPLREDIFISRSNDFNISNDLPTIYVTGGKTGSHKLNMLIKDSLEDLLTFSNIIHQCGEHQKTNDLKDLEERLSEIKNKPKIVGKYYIRQFISNNQIGEVFEKSDLIVSRSGAHIISELYQLNKPALLIPISWVSHDEQNKNAQYLRDIGLAEILNEDTINRGIFIAKVKEMLSNLGRYKIDYKSKPKLEKKPEEIIVDEIILLTK